MLSRSVYNLRKSSKNSINRYTNEQMKPRIILEFHRTYENSMNSRNLAELYELENSMNSWALEMLPKDYKVITWKERGVETEWDIPPRSMDEEPSHERKFIFLFFFFGHLQYCMKFYNIVVHYTHCISAMPKAFQFFIAAGLVFICS